MLDDQSIMSQQGTDFPFIEDLIRELAPRTPLNAPGDEGTSQLTPLSRSLALRDPCEQPHLFSQYMCILNGSVLPTVGHSLAPLLLPLHTIDTSLNEGHKVPGSVAKIYTQTVSSLIQDSAWSAMGTQDALSLLKCSISAHRVCPTGGVVPALLFRLASRPPPSEAHALATLIRAMPRAQGSRQTQAQAQAQSRHSLSCLGPALVAVCTYCPATMLQHMYSCICHVTKIGTVLDTMAGPASLPLPVTSAVSALGSAGVVRLLSVAGCSSLCARWLARRVRVERERGTPTEVIVRGMTSAVVGGHPSVCQVVTLVAGALLDASGATHMHSTLRAIPPCRGMVHPLQMMRVVCSLGGMPPPPSASVPRGVSALVSSACLGQVQGAVQGCDTSALDAALGLGAETEREREREREAEGVLHRVPVGVGEVGMGEALLARAILRGSSVGGDELREKVLSGGRQGERQRDRVPSVLPTFTAPVPSVDTDAAPVPSGCSFASSTSAPSVSGSLSTQHIQHMSTQHMSTQQSPKRGRDMPGIGTKGVGGGRTPSLTPRLPTQHVPVPPVPHSHRQSESVPTLPVIPASSAVPREVSKRARLAAFMAEDGEGEGKAREKGMGAMPTFHVPSHASSASGDGKTNIPMGNGKDGDGESRSGVADTGSVSAGGVSDTVPDESEDEDEDDSVSGSSALPPTPPHGIGLTQAMGMGTQGGQAQTRVGGGDRIATEAVTPVRPSAKRLPLATSTQPLPSPGTGTGTHPDREMGDIFSSFPDPSPIAKVPPSMAGASPSRPLGWGVDGDIDTPMDGTGQGGIETEDFLGANIFQLFQ
ncbi:hypothetical protein KIPB_002550 [Kipferlia bialata]|uniref:Uncharacterized protein n=1 Tax=Kipferlia bialata TaxID=797122 RepID=A0A9K3CRK4_9EUKA|nr:hypothetical protein KIPB_002550 [Kipferlia bialata]|eukprot:g2550.t1